VNRDLTRWQKNWSLMPAFFSATEIRTIRRRLASFQPRHIVVCSFESRFARSGGLAPVVMNTLPSLLTTGRFESVSLLSPFYPNLMDRTKLSETGVRFALDYAGRSVRAELLSLEVPCPGGSCIEYYLEADGFFVTDPNSALRDPYLYDDSDPAANQRALLDNAIFFCWAVPAALAAVGKTENVVLHLQEWQTALLSLTAKDAMLEGRLKSCGTVQTMHNPYDAFVSKADLAGVTTGAPRRARIERLPGDGLTAFEVGLQLVDAPVATVSENFATELTTDILQTEYFAPHLQRIFLRHPVVGINNGPFVPFSDKFPKRERHTIAEIAGIKSEQRRALLQILDTHRPPDRFGELTYRKGSILQLPDDIPIVVMSGRLDASQKGYDILLQALERFGVDEIKAVVTPMAKHVSDLAFFHAVADARPGNMTAFPMRMEKGYLELQAGATFGLMPSIYEPFGAAIEYMVNGTVNIVRATGGLVDQVSHGINGLSFREHGVHYNLQRIRNFMTTSDRVHLRKRNPWALDMVAGLDDTLRDARGLYRDRREDYHAAIAHGFARAQTFSWAQNAADYSGLYGHISTL
jgi:glycogen synthase